MTRGNKQTNQLAVLCCIVFIIWLQVCGHGRRHCVCIVFDRHPQETGPVCVDLYNEIPSMTM